MLIIHRSTFILTLLVSNIACVVRCSLFTFISFSFGLSVTIVHFVRGTDLLGQGAPDLVDAVSIVQSLEDSVTANHDEIEVILNPE